MNTKINFFKGNESGVHCYSITQGDKVVQKAAVFEPKHLRTSVFQIAYFLKQNNIGVGEYDEENGFGTKSDRYGPVDRKVLYNVHWALLNNMLEVNSLEAQVA